MRASIWTVAGAFVLLLALGLATTSASKTYSAELSGGVSALEVRVRSGDWAGAQEALEAVTAHWEDISPRLQVWVNHQDADEISQHLKVLAVGIEARERTFTLWQLAELSEAVSHIYHRDALTVENIF